MVTLIQKGNRGTGLEQDEVFQDIKQYQILVEHSLLLMIWNFNPAAYSLCKLETICNEDLAIPVPKLFS